MYQRSRAPMKLRRVASLATSSFKICDNQFIFLGGEGLRWGVRLRVRYILQVYFGKREKRL